MNNSENKISAWQKTGKPFYVSITGLQIKSPLKTILFFLHAIPSRSQALNARGNLYVGVKAINGVQHTLSVWESKDAMKSYIYQGAHMRAIKNFRRIATGKTFGYEATAVPTWEEVHQKWKDHGNAY